MGRDTDALWTPARNYSDKDWTRFGQRWDITWPPSGPKRIDFMETSQTTRQSFREAAQEYDHTPKLFRELMKYKDEIVALRQKGASFDTISELLQRDNVKASWKTVSRFCRKVTGSEKRRRKSAEAVPPPEPADSRSRIGDGSSSLTAALNAQRGKELGPRSARKRGPHITDSKNL